VERTISIHQVQGVHYQYHEKSILTKDGQPFPYEDKFPLRAWSRTEIIEAVEAAGFTSEADLTGKFAGRGEVYLLFRRKRVVHSKSEASSGQPKAHEDDDIQGKDVLGFFDGDYREHVPICLFPGDVQGRFSFMDCLPQIGDCRMLIFCELQKSLDDIRAQISRLVETGRIGVEAPYCMNLPVPNERREFFPDCENNPPTWVPASAKPPLERFWGHYCRLEIELGKRSLYLLHLGIGGQAVWRHFLQPWAVPITRIIIDPRDGHPGEGGVGQPPGTQWSCILANPPYAKGQ
jgi:hypothetical protein